LQHQTPLSESQIMRILIQRVSEASVVIDQKLKSVISTGLLVLVGIEEQDTKVDSEWLAGKVINLRIFNDQDGVMNKSVLDICGEVLVVSQFTLHAQTKKGNRPSYIKAAKHEIAIPLYEHFCSSLSDKLGKSVETGTFAADMKVSLINDGPVTIWMDSKNKE
jgi:D-tyrosyl-tRNA(Tyr) deacylase